MAKKFGKFLAFTALTGAACAAVYYILGNKKDVPYDDGDNGSSDFFEKKADREYVSLNADELKEKTEEIREKAEDTKEVIMNKLNEAAEELKEKAKEAAEGVGLVKEDKETEDFEFEDFATEEDENK